MSNFITHINFWVVLGFVGQFLFGSRFLYNGLSRKRRCESVIPEVFWYLSMAGSAILFTYAIYRRDPVFIMGQCSGLLSMHAILCSFIKRRDSWLWQLVRELISQKLLPNNLVK